MLNQAAINRLIHNNPCSGVKSPRSDKKDIEVFTSDEVKKMMEEAQKRRYPLVLILAYYAGMRISEILGLCWEDIDINKSTLTIKQTINSTSAGLLLAELKTKSSRRTIPLYEGTIKEIIKHKLHHGINTGLLFTNRKGQPFCKSNYNAVYRIIQAKTSIHKGIHVFRHTHASMLLASGMPIAEVAKRLGHKKLSTTLDIYGHFIPREDNKEIARKIGNILYPNI